MSSSPATVGNLCLQLSGAERRAEIVRQRGRAAVVVRQREMPRPGWEGGRGAHRHYDLSHTAYASHIDHVLQPRPRSIPPLPLPVHSKALLVLRIYKLTSNASASLMAVTYINFTVHRHYPSTHRTYTRFTPSCARRPLSCLPQER